MTPTGPIVESTPRASARRTIFRTLLLQSFATAALVLGVLVAAAGIDQRWLIFVGLLAVLGLSVGLSSRLGRTLADSRSSDSPKTVTPHLPESPHPVSLEALLNHLPWALWITDGEGRILHHNALALEWLDFAGTELKGQTVESWWTRWAGPATWSEIHRTVKGGGSWQGELELVTRDQRTASLEVTACPMPSTSDEQHVLFLAEDVTELRELGHVLIDLERQSTRGEMAGEVAHEINNFLTILGGNLDIIPMLLASGKQEKVQGKFVAMRGVLDKIASFSEGLMGPRDDAEPGPCDLNRQIESLVAFLKPQNRFDGVELIYRPDPDLPRPVVRVGQIQQVLVNLLNNAADAIHQGGRRAGQIEVTVRVLPERSELALTVSDNGPGLSKDASASIFRERFSDKKSGHGLGLLNCHAIARSLGGTLTAESAEGHGTSVTLTLPSQPGAMESPASTAVLTTS